MQGKVCLVTGATGGMGEVTARALAQQGATTVLVGRDAEKGRAAVARIRQATGNPRVDLLLADLSVQADIHRLAAEFRAGYPRLDVLVNNAGAVFGQRQLTADGIERTFALNHLSYFLLTHLLLDRLTASAPARVVNVASATHQMVKPADVGDWQSTRGYSMTQAYHRSKLANLLFTFELARRLAGTGVTVNAAKPGFTKSGLGQTSGSPLSLVLRLASALLGQSTEKGAETAIYLATAPELASVTGRYYDRQRAIESSPLAHDTALSQQLWQLSEQLTRLLPAQ